MKKLLFAICCIAIFSLPSCHDNVNDSRAFVGHKYYTGVKGNQAYMAYEFIRQGNACSYYHGLKIQNDLRWDAKDNVVTIKTANGGIVETAIYHPEDDYFTIGKYGFFREY